LSRLRFSGEVESAQRKGRVGQSSSELALVMFAIYLTIPFVFLALAIAAVPLWRMPRDSRPSSDHASMDSASASRPGDRLAAYVHTPTTTDSRQSTSSSRGDPQPDTSALSSGV
jgi:hypothetical protein